MEYSASSGGRPLDWMSNSPIKGLVALVVGGGSGIGAAAAKTLAANGGQVAVADRRPEMAEAVAAEITAAGGQAIAITMDVAKLSEINAALDRTLTRFGQLDTLINAAGVIMPAELETCSMEDWRTCFLVNVDAALLVARSCLPHLKNSACASIVNVASLAGGRGYPFGGAYGPSKAALISLTRQMALEWAQYGVRVNVVNPGTIDTPLTRANMSPATMEQRQERIPLHRLGVAGELGDLIVFLASPAASYITAQDINCDGGLSQALMVQKFYSNS